MRTHQELEDIRQRLEKLESLVEDLKTFADVLLETNKVMGRRIDLIRAENDMLYDRVRDKL